LNLLKSILLISLAFLLLNLFSCKDLNEEKKAPVLQMTWDTIVAQPSFILPNDTLLLTHTLASSENRNDIYHQTTRLPLDYVEFFGPDSEYVFSRSYPFERRFIEKAELKEAIPNGIRPGIYKFSAWVKDSKSQVSNTIEFKFAINSPDYPGIAVDTPGNGYLALNKVRAPNFKLKIRAFGESLVELNTEWYDSLKTKSLAEKEIYPIANVNEFTLVKNQIYPTSNGKLFYLKVVISNLSGRASQYWIPFQKI